MNAYVFNGKSQHALKVAISEKLGISYYETYKATKELTRDTVTTNDGRVFKLTLTEIKENE